MPVMDTFSKRLRALREERNLSQGEVSLALGISRGSLSFYENNSRTADIEILYKASKYFGVTPDYLLGKSDNRTPENTNIGQVTGLSDKAIDRLRTYMQVKDSELYAGEISAINCLLEGRTGIFDICREIALYLFTDISIYKDGSVDISMPVYDSNGEIVKYEIVNSGFWIFPEDLPTIQLLKIQQLLITLRDNLQKRKEGASNADNSETR